MQTSSSKKPIIGVTMDSSTCTHYSDYPWFALRENYCTSVEQAGGIVIPIPHTHAHIDFYLNMIDGLLVTGGNFDHTPSTYGDKEIHPTTSLNESRCAFDLEITKRALERDMPFFGICAGQQALNIVRGGSIIQSIPDEIENAMNHSQEECRHVPVHDIMIPKNCILFECNNNKSTTKVNTSHHQSVKNVGAGLTVTATCADGIIEGIEDLSLDFCVGVQWHPEFLVCDLDRNLYTRFIEVCRNRQESANKASSPDLKIL